MTNKPDIILYPAFLLKYMGHEVQLANQHHSVFEETLDELSGVTQTRLNNFDISHNNFLEDELKNQLMTYLFSCIYSDMINNTSLRPHCVAGLSMGLYAAMYCVQSITLEEGAILIQRVHQKMQEITEGESYAMLSVIGLSYQDLKKMITSNRLHCEIVIHNGSYSFILSGKSPSIEKTQLMAAEEGALHLNRFPVQIPYHSLYVKEIKKHKDTLLQDIQIAPPVIPVFSTTRLTTITSEEDMKEEIIQNLSNPINWHEGIETLHSKGNHTFLECGPGNSLKKMIKLMNRKYSITGVSEWLKKN